VFFCLAETRHDILRGIPDVPRLDFRVADIDEGASSVLRDCLCRQRLTGTGRTVEIQCRARPMGIDLLEIPVLVENLMMVDLAECQLQVAAHGRRDDQVIHRPQRVLQHE
jgi:hypothetical protein